MPNDKLPTYNKSSVSKNSINTLKNTKIIERPSPYLLYLP
jgi:hypothetical protein